MRTGRVLLLLLPLLAATPAFAQEKADEDAQAQEKEEARLLKRARRQIADDEKKEALEALKSLAQLARSRNHAQTAIDALSEALPLAQDTEEEAKLLDDLRFVEFREGQYGEAARHLERLAELRPDDAHIENELGAALHKAGRDEDSVRHLQRCLELDSKHSIARLTLGRVARLAGKPRKALRAHESLLALAKEGQPIDAGGWWVGFESKKQKARAKGGDFDRDSQRLALVKLEVAVDHAFLDELDEAEKIIARAKEELAESDLAPALEEAIDDLERALELRPAHFQLRYVLALLYGAKGDADSRKAELEKFVEGEKNARAFAKKARESLAELDAPAEKK